MSEPIAIGEPQRWTFHSIEEPDAGDLIACRTRVYLTLESRMMAERFQTDRYGRTRWRLTVVRVDPASIDEHVIPSEPCRVDGSPR